MCVCGGGGGGCGVRRVEQRDCHTPDLNHMTALPTKHSTPSTISLDSFPFFFPRSVSFHYPDMLSWCTSLNLLPRSLYSLPSPHFPLPPLPLFPPLPPLPSPPPTPPPPPPLLPHLLTCTIPAPISPAPNTARLPYSLVGFPKRFFLHSV